MLLALVWGKEKVTQAFNAIPRSLVDEFRRDKLVNGSVYIVGKCFNRFESCRLFPLAQNKGLQAARWSY